LNFAFLMKNERYAVTRSNIAARRRPFRPLPPLAGGDVAGAKQTSTDTVFLKLSPLKYKPEPSSKLQLRILR
jgi:hypothetical protein